MEQKDIIQKFESSRTILWTGIVNDQELSRNFDALKNISLQDQEPILLMLSNFGGSCSHGFGYYDMVRCVIKPELHTLVSGAAESMGVVLFLSATGKRTMTKNSSLFLHEMGTTPKNVRYSLRDLRAIYNDIEHVQKTYIEIVVSNSKGLISEETVLNMMEKETRLSPEECVKYGLCDHILS